MESLKKYSTRELVEELSTREGVERIDVSPYVQTVEVSVYESGKYPYDKIDVGPAIILWVRD